MTRKTTLKRRWAGVAMLGLPTLACSPVATIHTETATGAVHSEKVPSGFSLVPVKSSWRATESGFSGKLSWKRACVVETKTAIETRVVEETHADKGGNVAWLTVAGGAAAGGVYAASRIPAASSEVYCSDPNDEDSCSSERGALTKVAASAFLIAGTLGTAAILQMSKSPTRTVSHTESDTKTERGTARVACGPVSAFSGLVVSLDVPDGGSWKGTVTSDGEVEIVVADGTRIPVGVPMPVAVAEVPSVLQRFLRPGQVIGVAEVDASVARVTPR